jgi:preprotein translocase subunit SecG
MSLQIVTVIFNIAWLLALLVLLYLIWRSSEARLKHIQRMEITMFDIAKQDAETARKAVENNSALVEIMRKDNGSDH